MSLNQSNRKESFGNASFWSKPTSMYGMAEILAVKSAVDISTWKGNGNNELFY